MPQIKCTELTLGYDNNIVIENLSFSVNHGDYLCIVGENGSGKSTIIKALLHLIKPLSGRIETNSSSNSLTKIGYLPQQSEIPADFPATVREIVLSGCNPTRLRLFFNKAERKTAEFNMERLGITAIAEKNFGELSGGQKQRTLLARALCSAGDILLLDEPTSGLDPNGTREMYEIIKNINTDEKITIIMVSHDISAALGFSTHILHIGNNCTFFGTTEEYIKSPIAMAFSENRRDIK